MQLQRLVDWRIGTLAALALEVRSVGLGLCNLRFLTNATVAGCDPVPGRQLGSFRCRS